MSDLKLYRPVADGLEPSAVHEKNWRRRLRSRRWRVAPLDNPEGEPVGPLGGIMFFGGLALLTLVLLLVGYGIRFWG
jgi:hypothetical protein